MGTDPGAGFYEYKQRVIYSLFRAAVRIGVRLRVPLDSMLNLFRMAYFHEAREGEGYELAEIADLFGKSLRTVSSLHRSYRADFFRPEREIQLRRAVAEALRHSPSTRDQLVARFTGRDSAEIDAAIDDLLREERLVAVGEALHRNPSDHNYFDETDIGRRIDGLNRQMDILSQTVWSRLVAEGNGAGFARSYVFSATDRGFEVLVQGVLEKLRDEAISADAEAGDTGQRRGFTIAATTLEETP